jgi:hypothetical protein
MDGTRLQESNVSNVSILKNAFGIMEKVRENAWKHSYKTKQRRVIMVFYPSRGKGGWRETAVK